MFIVVITIFKNKLRILGTFPLLLGPAAVHTLWAFGLYYTCLCAAPNLCPEHLKPGPPTCFPRPCGQSLNCRPLFILHETMRDVRLLVQSSACNPWADGQAESTLGSHFRTNLGGDLGAARGRDIHGGHLSLCTLTCSS